MELAFKCKCGANHEVRLHDECRYCAAPISLIDWAMANLTNADLRTIIQQRGLTSGETTQENRGDAPNQAGEARGPSDLGLAKGTAKRVRKQNVD